MADRAWVVDASVLGAAFFEEADTEAARSFLIQEAQLSAPSLIGLEIASIAAKKVWRGQASKEVGARAVRETFRLVMPVEISEAMASRAFDLASDHRYSAYDAAYLALAEQSQAVVITLDAKLAARAEENGHGRYVRRLTNFRAAGAAD